MNNKNGKSFFSFNKVHKTESFETNYSKFQKERKRRKYSNHNPVLAPFPILIEMYKFEFEDFIYCIIHVMLVCMYCISINTST